MDDRQPIEELEADGSYNEQIDSGDVWRVIAEKVFQPCDGGPRRRTMYLATVDWAISMPSLSNSPWIRGAPHSGFSRLIRRTRLQTSADRAGRPTRCRDFQRQNKAKATSIAA